MVTMKVSRPRRYFALHYIIFRFLGLGWWHHPDQKDTRNFHGWYLYYSIITEILCVVGFVVLETIDPFIGEKDLDMFMFNLSFVITHNLTLIKVGIFFLRNFEIQDIVRTLEIDLQAFYQNNTLNRRTIKISRIMTAAFVFFGWATIANANVYGLIQDIHWKRDVSQLNDSATKPPRTLPLPIYIPWSYETEKSYVLSLLLETIGILWTGHIILTIDTFIGSVILHMSCQFVILQEAFLTAYDRTIERLFNGLAEVENIEVTDTTDLNFEDATTNRENFVIKYKTKKQIEEALEDVLKSCFRQHQILTSCVEKFSSTYSYGFMIQMLSSMGAICVVMVQISQDASSFKSTRLITSFAFFFAMIIQLALQCFTGNELTYQASQVAEAVMQCKWERMPPRLRTLLIMTIIRAQRPLHLTAAGFANMDNECFVSIMKAAYSYYVVLSQKQIK